MNSTLGSVVPLAMFLPFPLPLLSCSCQVIAPKFYFSILTIIVNCLHSLIPHERYKQVEPQPCCLYCERRSLPFQKVIILNREEEGIAAKFYSESDFESRIKMFLQRVYFQEFNASDFQDICSSSHL